MNDTHSINPYRLGQFLYYVNTCGFEDVQELIPFAKDSVEYNNLKVGFSDAFVDQIRFHLEIGYTKPSYLAMSFGIKDHERYILPRTN